MAESTPAASTPAKSPLSMDSLLSNAESALDDLHSGKLETVEDEPAEDEVEWVDESDAPAEESEEGEEDATPKPAALGSKEKPYSVKSLPEAYVTIKVDGEEQTVSVREMTDGYMREKAFHKKVGDVAEVAKRAQEAEKAFTEERTKLRESFSSLLADPDSLYDFLETHAEDTMDKVARKRLQVLMAEQKDPRLKWQREHEKLKRTTEEQNRKLREENERMVRTQQEEREHQKWTAAFKPGYEAGMKKAGYPKPTQEFKITFNGIINAIRATGRDLKAADVEMAIVKAAKLTEAETVEQRKPAPAPQRAPGQRPPAPKPQTAQNKGFAQLFRELDGASIKPRRR